MSFTVPTPPTNLIVKKGQQIEAAHHNGLVRFGEQLVISRGPLKGRQMPDGFTPRVKIVQSTDVDHPFKVTVDPLSGSGAATVYGASFSVGHVSGIIPKIDQVGLDAVDSKGNFPIFKIKPDAWSAYGTAQRALIMLNYGLDHSSYTVTSVSPIAVPKPPDFAPYQWNKLIAILILSSGSVTVKQMCFFNQQFYALNQRAGKFTAISMSAP